MSISGGLFIGHDPFPLGDIVYELGNQLLSKTSCQTVNGACHAHTTWEHTCYVTCVPDLPGQSQDIDACPTRLR